MKIQDKTMNRHYYIEIPMVKHGTEKLTERLDRFALRYRQVLAAGQSVSLPDNPMGRLAFQGHELIGELGLAAPEDRVMIHVNTFHRLRDLHEILDFCGGRNIRKLLVVSGDGSIRQPKLRPCDLGLAGDTVTSIELLGYIKKTYGDFFKPGVAFNQYEPEVCENEKLRRKLDAGAGFIITQPALCPTARLNALVGTAAVPVYLEAWMSPSLSLLSDCVGVEIAGDAAFEPLAALRQLEAHYPGNGFYLAVLNFARQFEQIVPPVEHGAE